MELLENKVSRRRLLGGGKSLNSWRGSTVRRATAPSSSRDDREEQRVAKSYFAGSLNADNQGFVFCEWVTLLGVRT